MELRL